jgi:hypothetical protein
MKVSLVEENWSCQREELTARESISLEDLWFKPRKRTILPMAAATRLFTVRFPCLRALMISADGVLATAMMSRRRTRLTSLSLFERAINSSMLNVLTMAERGISRYTLVIES